MSTKDWIETITRSLVALMLVATGCYMAITGEAMPVWFVEMLLALGGAYLGISAGQRAKYKNGNGGRG